MRWAVTSGHPLGGVGHNAGGVDTRCLYDLLPFLRQVSKSILIKKFSLIVPYIYLKLV